MFALQKKKGTKFTHVYLSELRMEKSERRRYFSQALIVCCNLKPRSGLFLVRTNEYTKRKNKK